MKKLMVSCWLLLIALAFCVSAFPWAAEHPQGLPLRGPTDWPSGLKELLSREGRVYGYFVNANDFFFFAGDSDALNEFLEEYAKLKDTPLTLVLHPGRGKTGKFGYGEEKIEFDWQVNVLRRGWHPEAPEEPKASQPSYVVTVEAWLGGKVELSKLKVPVNVQVKSEPICGEIEKFVSQHDAKCKQAEKAK